MCSAEGYSWVMALDAASGGRSDVSIFDANRDLKINSEDLVIIGADRYSITGFKLDKRVYMPGRLYDAKTNTEKQYYGVDIPPTDTKPSRTGVVIWQEMN